MTVSKLIEHFYDAIHLRILISCKDERVNSDSEGLNDLQVSESERKGGQIHSEDVRELSP